MLVCSGGARSKAVGRRSARSDLPFKLPLPGLTWSHITHRLKCAGETMASSCPQRATNNGLWCVRGMG